MFSGSIASLLILSLALHASGHALIAPMLGVARNPPIRDDVQRPSNEKPCGEIDIARTIDTSRAVELGGDGTFNVTVTSFNAGRDGSRQVTLKIDPTGTGRNFVAGTIKKNGDLDPASTGDQQVIAALPANTTCTGGQSRDLCLASFTTASGFGNCVVVKQLNAAATSSSSSSVPLPNDEPPPSCMDPEYEGSDEAPEGGTPAGASDITGITTYQSVDMSRVVGSRAPRALREIFQSSDGHLNTSGLGLIAWMWQ